MSYSDVRVIGLSKIVCKVPAPISYSTGKRVLCYAEAWGQGGIETFLMELFSRLQGNGVSFSLYSCWDWNDSFDDELAKLGIDRYTVFSGYKPGQLKRLCDGSKGFAELANAMSPDAVYINTMNGMGFLYSEVAMKCCVPVRVVHSHNSAFGSGQAAAKAVMHAFGKTVLSGSATACLACSSDAGRYLFGNRPFEVVNNGIDTERFRFDAAARAEIRESFDIPQNAFLFGNVGRIAEVKNPFFQIRVFAEILKREPNSYYLMVGEGDLRPQVEELVDELAIREKVIMPGYLPDPAPVYSALDCFLMPSLFDGLAIVCIAAQCSGCTIVCSEALPSEAHVTDVEASLPLSAGEPAWADRAVEMVRMSIDRDIYAALVRSAGFDADHCASIVRKHLLDRVSCD